jgi:hypothetical protein
MQKGRHIISKAFSVSKSTTTEDILLLKPELYLKILFVQRSKHTVCMIDINLFVLQGDRTKHKNSPWTE